MRAVQSSAPVTHHLPSGETTRELMRPLWPCSTWRQVPVCRSHTLQQSGGNRGGAELRKVQGVGRQRLLPLPQLHRKASYFLI